MIGRLDTYVKVVANQPEIEKKILFNQSISSIINSLASENFRNSLSNDTTEKLIVAFIQNSENVKTFSDNDRKNMIDLATVKVEAGLKGFELEKVQDLVALEAVKKVALELKGQGIPKSDYANVIINKTMERLQQDSSLSPEQLNIFKQAINKANSNPNC
ncbi:MAG: hypothetical protein RCG15_03055 [Candidatus Rickettsia vulgarisii]